MRLLCGRLLPVTPTMFGFMSPVVGVAALEKRHGVLTGGFAEVAEAEPGPLTLLHRHRTLQVGEGEVRLAVAAVGRSEQREERRILGDRQKLTVAEGPALRREVEREDADLCYEWI